MSPPMAAIQALNFKVLPRFVNGSEDSPTHTTITPTHTPVAAAGSHVSAVPTPHPPMPIPPGPPYPPMYAVLGGLPTTIPDVPVSAIFLAMFLIAGIAHIRIFRGNLSKSHRFVFSAATAAFCVIRVASTALRIAWSQHQQNIRLAMAAQILVAAGVVILYITNMFFTQRLLFARHPGSAFKILILRPAVLATILTIIAVIVVVVQSFYTLDPNTHRIDRDVQLYGLTYLTAMASLPIFTIILMMVVPRHRNHAVKVASGEFGTNAFIVLICSVLLALGAAWRCSTAWLNPVPLPGSPWYLQKACFYVFDFGVEILVVILYLVFRVDRRFYVPAEGDEAVEDLGPPISQSNLKYATGSGYSSPGSSGDENLKGEKHPLFVQLVLEVDPTTGKYHIGHESVLQQQRGHLTTYDGK